MQFRQGKERYRTNDGCQIGPGGMRTRAPVARTQVGPGMKRDSLVDLFDASFTAVIRHAIPEWTPVGHRDGPMCHRALRVGRATD
jgi:hypothetical protein